LRKKHRNNCEMKYTCDKRARGGCIKYCFISQESLLTPSYTARYRNVAILIDKS
jgi:hypothetical protein